MSFQNSFNSFRSLKNFLSCKKNILVLTLLLIFNTTSFPLLSSFSLTEVNEDKTLKLRFVTSPTDSPEYTDYKNKFSSGSFTFSSKDAPYLGLIPFLEKKEISAFKTLLELPPTGPLAAPQKLVRYFVENYRTYYSQNADILESAGTFYINVQEYDFAFHLYDHVQTMGKLSPDGLYNYITHSLLERAADYISVKKAWHMLQDWQKQFEGSPSTSRITSTDITSNTEILYLIKVYELLFEVMATHTHYYPVLEEIMDFRIKKDTPSVINTCILDAFISMLQHTPYANFKVGQPIKGGRNNYEKVIHKNLTRLTVEAYKHDQLFQDMVTENIKSLLQKEDSIKNFPEQHFKKDFDPQNITLNQYIYWARKIINSHRKDLLVYNERNLFVMEKCLKLDNVELEKIVVEALKQIHFSKR